MRKITFLSLVVLLLFTSACSGPAATPTATTAPQNSKMELTSSAFNQGSAIPAKYSCQGEQVSFALDWSAPPAGTQSLALIMSDPDAPVGTFIHWVVYNLPASTRSLSEGASGNLPSGTIEGQTSAGSKAYVGPCPPSGQHRYYLRIYALDSQVSGDALDESGLQKAMSGHILAQGELMGVFEKQ
jgi:Raf kinase inhibitor-like YbhB/YbcL family protein